MKIIRNSLVLLLICTPLSVAKNSHNKNFNSKKITVFGISDGNILTTIDEQVTIPLKETTKLERDFWIKRNTKTISDILCAFGYFDAKVFPSRNNFEKFDVKLNSRYTISSVECSYAGHNISETVLDDEQFFLLTGLKRGDLFLASEISSIKNRIRDFYKDLGFAFVHVSTPKIALNSVNKSVKIIYNVDLGRVIKIRHTKINIKSKKSPKLLEPFIRNRVTWKTNERYSLKALEQFKNNLAKYQLFSSLNIELSEPTVDKNDPDYALSDIILDIEEAPLRSVQLGANLNTSSTFNILAGWKHYNIDGKGSTFEVLGNFGKDEQILKVEHNYYDLFTKNQRLSTQAKFTHEDEIPYNVLKYCVDSMIWYDFGNTFEFGIGGFCEYSKTIDKVVTDEKLINTNVPYIRTLGIPIGIKVDATDDSIDPHRGLRIAADFTPMFSKDVNYSKFLGALYGYFNIGKNYSNRETVFAIYAKYGTIFGDIKNLTRDKMFFAGGSNSVRGYGEKKLGALLDRIPYGGSTLTEFGVECRIKFNKTIGGVVFVETGKLCIPEKNQNWMTGWGCGLRYYTPMGLPVIRIDIAFPTKRRTDSKGKYVDALFNIYFGIGQTF